MKIIKQMAQTRNILLHCIIRFWAQPIPCFLELPGHRAHVFSTSFRRYNVCRLVENPLQMSFRQARAPFWYLVESLQQKPTVLTPLSCRRAVPTPCQPTCERT